jgi:signal transduction histidine kinase
MESKPQMINKKPQSRKVSFYSEQNLPDLTPSEWIKEKNRLVIINEVGLAVTQMLDVDQILQFTEDVLVKKIGVAECLIYLWNEETEYYKMWHSYGVDDRMTLEIEMNRQAGMDFVQEIADSHQPKFVPKIDKDKHFNSEMRKKYTNHYYFGFPLISRTMVIGVIELISPALPKYETKMISFLESLGREFGIAIDNALLVAKARKQQEDAMTLYHLGTKISSSLILSEVLEAVAESARTLLKTEVGVVGLYRESCQEIKIWSANGEGGKNLEGLTFNLDQSGLSRKLFVGEIVSGKLNENTVTCFDQRTNLDLIEFDSFLAIPLHLGERFLGSIGVLSRRPRQYSNSDIQLIKQLGYHVFVSIENARLHQQLRYGATLEEQNRLARELHDNLAQAMGFIKIKAIMSNDMLQKQDYEKVQLHLNELIATTSVLYTDIREAIFNLRNTDAHEGDFFIAFQEYLTEYQQYYGLEVRLKVDDTSSIEFPPEVGNQLIRVIQEALSNVRRHACAHRVWIQFWQEQGEINMSIEDDGSGFDVNEIATRNHSKQSFGLQIMQERIQQINGKLKIESEPGKGTKVLLQIPSVYIQ